MADHSEWFKQFEGRLVTSSLFEEMFSKVLDRIDAVHAELTERRMMNSMLIMQLMGRIAKLEEASSGHHNKMHIGAADRMTKLERRIQELEAKAKTRHPHWADMPR